VASKINFGVEGLNDMIEFIIWLQEKILSINTTTVKYLAFKKMPFRVLVLYIRMYVPVQI